MKLDKVLLCECVISELPATQDGGYATRLPDDDDVDEENDN